MSTSIVSLGQNLQGITNPLIKYQTGLKETQRQLQNFEGALGMIAWVHIFTAMQSALTPTACYGASVNPWTETT
jgi:hypothetical protein